MPNRVREWRLRRGMPVSELARRAGVSRQSVYTAEADGRVSFTTMVRFAKALEVKLTDLCVVEPSEAVA